jgi:hypothetical protein
VPADGRNSEGGGAHELGFGVYLQGGAGEKGGGKRASLRDKKWGWERCRRMAGTGRATDRMSLDLGWTCEWKKRVEGEGGVPGGLRGRIRGRGQEKSGSPSLAFDPTLRVRPRLVPTHMRLDCTLQARPCPESS